MSLAMVMKGSEPAMRATETRKGTRDSSRENGALSLGTLISKNSKLMPCMVKAGETISFID
jgi:hypothetical protein